MRKKRKKEKMEREQGGDRNRFKERKREEGDGERKTLGIKPQNREKTENQGKKEIL